MNNSALDNHQHEKRSLSYRFGRGSMKCFQKLLIVPGMQPLFKNTFLGACRQVNLLTQKGDTEQAISHLVQLLDSDKFKSKRTYRWWYLMRQAVSLSQDFHLQSKHAKPDEIKKMVHLVQNGPSPKVGYDAAYCYVGLALWAFQAGNRSQAIQCVQKAIHADNEWGYPEYLMGWLGLFESSIDPIPHFMNALNYNWSFFHRINKDPICQQHPDIIRQVRQRVSQLTH